jgi:histidinol-phosphate aminotransferase
MFKYNKNAVNLEPYKIPSTTTYKYKMDMGEWGFPIHSSVIEKVKNFENLYRYGVVDNEFNELLDEIKKYNKLNNNEETVLLTNGSDNALRLVLDLFVTKESKFLIPIPSYVHFESMLDTFAIHQIDKPYMDYKLSNEELNELILLNLKKGYDLCYLVNPSMPIGHLLSKQNLINMLEKHPNTVFIVDEAYIEFSNNESLSPLVEKFNNLIVIRTFSKFFSLASLRIGYLITNKTIINLLKPYYNYKDITKLSVSCALASLKNIEFYDENKKEYFELKNYIISNLQEIIKTNEKINDYIMNNGMYFTIICNEPNELKKYFDSHDIAVRNKDCDIKGAIRLTINNKEIMEYVFKKLREYN